MGKSIVIILPLTFFLPSVYVWKKMTHDILFFFNYAKIYTEEFKNSPLNVITKPYPKMIKNQIA